jgi:hypothetical protein
MIFFRNALGYLCCKCLKQWCNSWSLDWRIDEFFSYIMIYVLLVTNIKNVCSVCICTM